MRYTLLQVVQLILSAMDSDEVNSISDTTEALQVANLCKSVYFDIATDLGLPEREGVVSLEASNDPDLPIQMTTPTTVVRVSWVKYNWQTSDQNNANYKDVRYLPLKNFVEMQLSLANGTTSNVAEATITSPEGQEFKLMYRTDKGPQWYTCIGNMVLFDSFDSSVDTTLQESKVLAGGIIYPAFDLDDSFEPPLNPTEFSYFVNKCKTRAFAELKQAQNAESASETRRQKIIVQKRKRRLPTLTELQKLKSRYGRK